MTIPSAATDSYDPLAAASKQRSHEIFGELRAGCPVHHHPMPEAEVARQRANPLVAAPTEEFWTVTRYGDCVELLQDGETYSNIEGPGPERMLAIGDGMLLVSDEPAHRRQRQIANKAFLPRMVELRRPLIQDTLDDLVDAVTARGRADVMADIAIPLTVAMITDFFGVGGDRRGDVARWGQAVIAALGGDAETAQAGAMAVLELFGFLNANIDSRRARLAEGEALPDDVLSALITAEHEGSRFSNEEICLAAQQFLSAGFETTATAIGNAVFLLCTHPDQRARLEADWSLLDAACEEVLRYESPVEGTFRTTTRPVLVAGRRIPAGAKVRVVYASANRDERQFDAAAEFRIDRPLAALRGHVAFGHGRHACIGSALARAELGIAVRTLLRRLPGLTLDPERAPERTQSFTVNGFATMPIVFDPATARPRDTAA